MSPKGKCTECENFLKTDPDPKKCTCKKFKGYITQNALRNLSCQFFKLKETEKE